MDDLGLVSGNFIFLKDTQAEVGVSCRKWI